MRGKTYKAVKEKAPQQAVSIEEAITFLKENKRAKFDETIEVHIRLNVDSEKSDQMVRGSVVLPGGTPKQKKVAVFTEDPTKQEQAKQAGAHVVGGQDLIATIEGKGVLDADVTVATPDMMPKIAKVAKILGPKGLMPNPKSGTVTPDPAAAVKELIAGKVSFKMDPTGNIHEGVAKVSWDAAKVAQNIEAFIEAVEAAKPKTVKGKVIKKVTVTSTMSPGIVLTW